MFDLFTINREIGFSSSLGKSIQWKSLYAGRQSTRNVQQPVSLLWCCILGLLVVVGGGCIYNVVRRLWPGLALYPAAVGTRHNKLPLYVAAFSTKNKNKILFHPDDRLYIDIQFYLICTIIQWRLKIVSCITRRRPRPRRGRLRCGGDGPPVLFFSLPQSHIFLAYEEEEAARLYAVERRPRPACNKTVTTATHTSETKWCCASHQNKIKKRENPAGKGSSKRVCFYLLNRWCNKNNRFFACFGLSELNAAHSKMLSSSATKLAANNQVKI